MDDAGLTLTAREVPARRLPVPSSVSPQLQRSISTLAAAPALGDAAAAPQTTAEWKAFIARTDAQTIALNPILAGLFPHTIVRREIAGVTVREITTASLDPANAPERLTPRLGSASAQGEPLNAGAWAKRRRPTCDPKGPLMKAAAH